MVTFLEREKLLKEGSIRNVGITIRPVGIGDGIQFTSLPENFYKATGQKLIDISKPWYLDHNPYVLRDVEPKKVIELWNHPKQYDWPKPRSSVYMTNAEIHAEVLGIKNPTLNHPKLYKFEDYPFFERETILFHPFGKSHGTLPQHVIDHVIKKYEGNDYNLYQIGLPTDPDIGIQRAHTETLWDLVHVISRSKMFIGVDSGPSWIAACFPDVQTKKIRTTFQYGYCDPKDWVALDVNNCHSFWDDTTLFKIYNCTERDLGFTRSYGEI